MERGGSGPEGAPMRNIERWRPGGRVEQTLSETTMRPALTGQKEVASSRLVRPIRLVESDIRGEQKKFERNEERLRK
jgi:hypothetical protein